VVLHGLWRAGIFLLPGSGEAAGLKKLVVLPFYLLKLLYPFSLMHQGSTHLRNT
jgi:hypothetical protein